MVRDQNQIDEYYQALVQKDSRYTGVFFACVKTTTVFCISTCSARKPMKENVEYCSTFKEALQNGYRPCKICKPTENANEAPLLITKAIQLVIDNPKEKISDQTLREHSISPDVVRRWFNRHYGITFHAYQRMYRINNAYKELKDGKKATDIAYDQGYGSLSGFGYTYKKLIGKAPRQSSKQLVILISRTTTPIGPMWICATDNGICLLEFTDRKMLETEFKDLQRLLKAQILIGENEHSKQGKKELKEYFAGDRHVFDVTLDTPGTEYQREVWNVLQDVKFGTTSTYQSLAAALGDVNAVRAVARANGFNRVSIMVPCHRIIGKDGNLTGYGGGIERKKWLIEHEGRMAR